MAYFGYEATNKHNLPFLTPLLLVPLPLENHISWRQRQGVFLVLCLTEKKLLQKELEIKYKVKLWNKYTEGREKIGMKDLTGC